MKKNYGVFFGFAVLLITTIFTLAACGDTGDLTSPPENIPAKVATPTANPAEGVVASGTAITLTTATEGAAIYYTVNGSTPTSSSIAYSETSKPTVRANPTTIKAIAVKSGMVNSDVLTASYTIEGMVVTPTASPAAGEVALDTEITLTTATEGAAIYYTVNGSDPTSSSTAYSDGKPKVTANPTTIKAIAVKSGMTTSAILTAVYTPDPIPIGSLQELNAISTDAANLSKNYKLTADITGPITAPIGSVSGNMVPFTGEFDGNGHTITVSITSGAAFSMGEYSGIYAGLFAGIGTGGSVHDLTVTGTVTITNSGNGMAGAGGVVGGMLPGASISNVESSVAVTVTSTASRDVLAGGIVGGLQGGTVSNSHATGVISAESTATSGDINVDAGGAVGAAQGVISRVYATGNVTATGNSNDDGNVQAGGVAGAINDPAEVRNAYATGNVSATGKIDVRAGGVVGNVHEGKIVKYVYATGVVSVTVNGSDGQAGGIVGEFYHGGEVSNAVALNASINISGSSSSKKSQRVIGRYASPSIMANNYGKADLTPTGSYTERKGSDQQDGADVTASNASTQTWWTGTGFSGADWETIWQWDGTSGLPKLR
jgi:predicted small lipoprotein YifL